MSRLQWSLPQKILLLCLMFVLLLTLKQSSRDMFNLKDRILGVSQAAIQCCITASRDCCSNCSISKARGINYSGEWNGDLRKPVCSWLFNYNESEMEYTKLYLNKTEYKSPENDLFMELTKDCESYKSQRYFTEPLSQEEKDFPLGFGIRMHKNVAQVEQLLRAIYMPQNVYCIYIDKKATQEIHQVMALISRCLRNVFIASHVEDFIYTGFSPVGADLQCMQDMLNTTVQWKYFINVAGSEFPLKTNLEMVRILKLLNGTNDIEQYPYPKKYLYRLTQKYEVEGYNLVETGTTKQTHPPGFVLHKGCSYNLFSREFVQWVLNDDLPRSFINWTRDTSSPDEVVWATLNYHPRAPGGYQHTVTQVSKTFLSREVIWAWSPASCHGQKFMHSVCILSSSDLNWLSRRWEFFANKFDPEYDHVVLDCLEERHFNRTLYPDPDHTINWESVKRAPHVQDALKRNV